MCLTLNWFDCFEAENDFAAGRMPSHICVRCENQIAFQILMSVSWIVFIAQCLLSLAELSSNRIKIG